MTIYHNYKRYDQKKKKKKKKNHSLTPPPLPSLPSSLSLSYTHSLTPKGREKTMGGREREIKEKRKKETKFRSCVRVEVAVLGCPS